MGLKAGLDRNDAEDLLQDVLLVLARKLPEFEYDQSKSFRGWLCTVTLNKLRENARKRTLPAVQMAGSAWERVADQRASDLLDDQEYRQMIVLRALKLIQVDFAATTWRACWEHMVSGRTAKEVGQELGLSEGAVYAAKFRVLNRLRQELEGLLDL